MDINSTRLCVVIPMKPLGESKMRLEGCLSPGERRGLSLVMLARVLLAVRTAAGVARTWVIGGDSVVAGFVRALGAHWFPDGDVELNKSLSGAFYEAFATDVDGVLFLPADLPFVNREAVEEVVRASANLTRVVLSPALRDGGTNALLLPRHRFIVPKLGQHSFLRHQQVLAEHGFAVELHVSPHIGLDIDTPEDWRYLTAMCPSLSQSLADWCTVYAKWATNPTVPEGTFVAEICRLARGFEQIDVGMIGPLGPSTVS